jgi:tetratricopeptide (TPR) repeat protein
MNWKAFISIPLLSLAAFAAAAQQVPATNPAAAAAAQHAPSVPSPGSSRTQASGDVTAAVTTAPAAKPALTPRQIAEMRAQIMMARKMYGGAIIIYGGLLKQYPKDAGLLNQMGIAYQELGDDRDAGRYYKKAIHADHHFASPLNNLGTVEYEQKMFAKAVKLYTKALAERGDAAAVYCNLGYAYFARKLYPDAMHAFNQALTLDPQVFEHRGGEGSLVQQRSVTDPGLFYFYVAKAYAAAGDAEHCTHYLKLARDEGYAQFASVQTDPAFAALAKDPQFKLLFVPEKPVVETR